MAFFVNPDSIGYLAGRGGVRLLVRLKDLKDLAYETRAVTVPYNTIVYRATCVILLTSVLVEGERRNDSPGQEGVRSGQPWTRRKMLVSALGLRGRYIKEEEDEKTISGYSFGYSNPSVSRSEVRDLLGNTHGGYIVDDGESSQVYNYFHGRQSGDPFPMPSPLSSSPAFPLSSSSTLPLPSSTEVTIGEDHGASMTRTTTGTTTRTTPNSTTTPPSLGVEDSQEKEREGERETERRERERVAPVSSDGGRSDHVIPVSGPQPRPLTRPLGLLARQRAQLSSLTGPKPTPVPFEETPIADKILDLIRRGKISLDEGDNKGKHPLTGSFPDAPRRPTFGGIVPTPLISRSSSTRRFRPTRTHLNPVNMNPVYYGPLSYYPLLYGPGYYGLNPPGVAFAGFPSYRPFFYQPIYPGVVTENEGKDMENGEEEKDRSLFLEGFTGKLPIADPDEDTDEKTHLGTVQKNPLISSSSSFPAETAADGDQEDSEGGRNDLLDALLQELLKRRN
ncbi:unnamed protein product [Darwinula stevensoni]|uniref:Uncharacterized protein n=1 Tax=Darwinula stevensoni TaxID=69355 RepID=A0A7R8ZYD8_9CRUS|nr:unnamed protein product [Darwinula stevensoni]CAG0880256.1 unnamed protein product [Darwinula stevensoni]